MSVYSEYSRDRIGWFFGLTGPQVVTVVLSAGPILWAVSRQAWLSAALFVVIWVVVALLSVVPIWGRSATNWGFSAVLFAVGAVTGWSRFRSGAATGASGTAPDVPDLPGPLQGIQVHDGPPSGVALARSAVIQDHAAKTWAMSAAVAHPGLGFAGTLERAAQGRALGELLDAVSKTELVDQVLFMVRTVPDDGAERAHWVAQHARSDAPALSRQVNADMQTQLADATVRTEAFVTFVCPEAWIGRHTRRHGNGVAARAEVMLEQAREIQGHLVGGLRMDQVTWLTSPELAAVCRTGFAPGDRASLIDARVAKQADPQVNDRVPWSLAGPCGAEAAVRHYTHDAWHSVSATIKLPARGALMGALAPVLTPTEPGERRSFVVCYPVMRQGAANRKVANSEWAADLSSGVRHRLGVKERARNRVDADAAHGMDHKLARGSSMTHPYAICTVTVPNTSDPNAAGRRLDASVRRAGFAPLRLDLAQDLGFAACAVPLGLGLTRQGT